MTAALKKWVFLLEDDDELREVLKDAIELEIPADFGIREFSGLSELRVACAITQPSLIVSDLNVLDAGPAEVVGFLQSDIPKSLPIIISSGNTAFMTPLKNASRFKIFTKGYPFSVLASHINEALAELSNPHHSPAGVVH